MRALIVEDDRRLRAKLEELLRSRGHEVAVCGDGDSAWLEFERLLPRLVILDWQLAGGAAPLLCRRIRAAGRRSMVVALTRPGDGRELSAILEVGADDYIVNAGDEPLLRKRIAAIEQAVRDSSAHWRFDLAARELEKAMERIHFGVTITDPGSRIIYLNSAEAGMHGYDPDELMGCSVSLLAANDGRSQPPSERLGELRNWRREAVDVRKDGSRFPVQLVSDVVVDPTGAPLAVVTSCEDISERRRAEEALRESEARYRSLVDAAADLIAVADLDGVILSLNPAFETITGAARSEWVGRRFEPLVHPEDVPAARAALASIAAGGNPPTGEARLRRRDGGHVIVEYKAAPFVRAGRVVGALLVARDVTEQREGERRLRESEERYALAMRGANDGLWDWDLRSGQVHFSGRWKAMLGHGEADIGNAPAEWLERVHEEDRTRLQAAIALHLRGETDHFEDEHRMRRSDGRYRWMLARGLAVRDPAGIAYRLVGSQTDVTDRRTYDVLTGLPNRALFLDRLEHAALASARRPRAGFAVLFLDLDRFKVVNDRLGHAAGDRLLCAVAARLRGAVRPRDTVARFGGDEFAILLDPIAGPTDATRVAERIQSELGQLAVSASIGIALGAAEGARPEEYLRGADAAMYRAKGLGRARHVLFDEVLNQQAITLSQLESDLRCAVGREELRVHYQPIVELDGGRVVGFEALLRWQHPRRGLLGPAEFLAAAGDAGLLMPFERWVLGESCRQLAAWRSAWPGAAALTISVNQSARRFGQPELVADVAEALRASGLPGDALKLDVTESWFRQEGPAVAEVIAALERLGVRLHIDDFGTGYSSLSYLHRYHFEALKVDHSFVARLGGADDAAALVRSILALGSNLGVDVVAEGVETAPQLARLRELGCARAQGYFFAPPLEPEAAAAWLARA